MVISFVVSLLVAACSVLQPSLGTTVPVRGSFTKEQFQAFQDGWPWSQSGESSSSQNSTYASSAEGGNGSSGYASGSNASGSDAGGSNASDVDRPARGWQTWIPSFGRPGASASREGSSSNSTNDESTMNTSASDEGVFSVSNESWGAIASYEDVFAAAAAAFIAAQEAGASPEECAAAAGVAAAQATQGYGVDTEVSQAAIEAALKALNDDTESGNTTYLARIKKFRLKHKKHHRPSELRSVAALSDDATLKLLAARDPLVYRVERLLGRVA